MRSCVQIIFDDYSIEFNNLNANERRAVAIEQVDDEGNVVNVFSSIAGAQKALGIYHISECVNGIRKKAGGFYWRVQGE